MPYSKIATKLKFRSTIDRHVICQWLMKIAITSIWKVPSSYTINMSWSLVETMFYSFKLSRAADTELNAQTLLMLFDVSTYIQTAEVAPNFHLSLPPLPLLCNFVVFCHSDSRPSYVNSFRQWDVSKCTYRGLKNAYAFALAFSRSCVFATLLWICQG